MGAGRPFGEDPYCYLKPDDDQLKSCVYVRTFDESCDQRPGTLTICCAFRPQ